MITADDARRAFWTALRDLQNDPELSPAQMPVFDEQDGPGGSVDGLLPEQFYEHLAEQLNESNGVG